MTEYVPEKGDLKDLLDGLLQGAIDTHIHGAPDIVPRRMSANALARAAQEAGMAAILIKCHHVGTASAAQLAAENVTGLKVFGGVALNITVGGLSPHVVETQLKLGAKEIWMPTQSAVNDLEHGQGDLQRAVRLTDDSGSWLPELHLILEMIAQYDVILGTGHLHPEESEKLISLAQSKGVKRILFTHPELVITKAPLEMQKRLAKKGVLFERTFYSSNPTPYPLLPVAAIAEQIKEVGVESTVVATDFGQKTNDEPVVGMKRFIAELMGCGLKPAEIETMIKTNPASILGL